MRKGQKYYLEVLHHAGKGDDHLTVAVWSKGLQFKAPIPGNLLSTPAGRKGRILREYWLTDKKGRGKKNR